MTDKVKIIRQEVEKLKSNLIYGACSSQIAMETRCKEEAYNEVLALLDTMQEEPVSRTPADIEAAMQEVEKKSRAFTEAHHGEDADTILAQMRGEEPVNQCVDCSNPYQEVLKRFKEAEEPMVKKNQKTTAEALLEMADELGKAAADLTAFMTGGIGPTQQEYIDKINADWSGYNFIVVFGHVYRLTNEKKYKDNGALRCPCEVCELRDDCCQDGNKVLCRILRADTDEYFYDAGELVIDKRGKMKVEKWFG